MESIFIKVGELFSALLKTDFTMDASLKIFCLVGTSKLIYLVTGLTNICMMEIFALTG